MRTYDPPPYTAPHERIAAKQKLERECDAREAAAEVKYALPIEKIPSVLVGGPPQHPRAKKVRRFAYTVYDRSWRLRWDREACRRGVARNGWRNERAAFLANVERFRRAEIEVRKQRAVKKGRGKPLPKNHFASRRNAVEKREFREKNW